MTASNEDRDRSPAPLRLRLSPTPRGRLAGAWWPRSRDADVELASLVDDFPPDVGRISRMLYSPPDWASKPHRVKVGRGWVKAGSFPRDDTHLLLLTLTSGQRLSLLVIPPETPAAEAEHLLAAASSPDNHSTGTQLLADAVAARV